MTIRIRSLPRVRPAPRSPANQRGIILAVTMIVLVIMLLSAIALIRSYGTSVGVAGNLAIRRDLVNQAERATGTVVSKFGTTGSLTTGLRDFNQVGFNYSACALPADVHGVPTLLSDTDANFANTNDLTPSPWTDPACISPVASGALDITDPVTQTVVRYVIDRQCVSTGDSSTQGCASTPISPTKYGCVNCSNVNPPTIPVYRLSIRASDPRGTRTYLQTTFSN
jgi:type IV pilus assembly protein PilX